MKKVITTFQHPDLDSPWTTWDTVMESEELFRNVCTSNHELFVACASLLTEQSENVNDNQYDNYSNNNYNNDNYLRESRAYLIDTTTTTTAGSVVDDDNDNSNNKEKVYWNSNNENNPNIRLRSDCEELLRTILPFWETIRRERSIIVDRCRPKPSSSSNSSSMNTHIIENNKKGEDSMDTTNDWMGWLRTVVTGNESSSSSSSSSTSTSVVGSGGGVDNITSGVVVTAHLDPEYAPNQFHYTKLVGRLYFHYLPLELFHKRFRPPYNNTRTAFNTDGDDNDTSDSDNDNNNNNGNDDTVDDDDNYNYKNDYLPSYSAWEQKRGEILQQRAEQIQYVVDQSSYNNDVSTESNIDNNINSNNNNIVLTDKIIRLLVRSYRDMSTLEAAQQAERVYNRHPHHQKGLLWYVLMCYLKTITQYTAHDMPGENYRDRKLRYYKDAAIAAERICKLFFSKHSMSKHWKDSRGELYNCSIVAFEALARLPDRHHLRGYYERVHSLGIVKFGPKAWEALISTHKVDGPDRFDLSQALHAKDHKVLNFLIQIYSNDGEYLDRALRLLDVSFDVYSTHDLQESLEQSTFQKLIKRLRNKSRKRINNMKNNKEKDAVKLGGKTSRCSYDSNSNKNISELETAFRLLDKMVLHEKWFPDLETFNYLFPMAIYGDNPGPDAESIRAKLEACRFLASMSSSSIPNTAGVDSVTFSSNTVPDLCSPIRASNRTLNAWLQTVDNNEGVVPPREPNPAERAWEIIRALRVGSSPLFLPIEKGISRSLYDPDHIPDEILYALALKVCSRVNNSSKPLDVALDIFDVVQKEGILLEGSICLNLIRVISNSTNLIRRVEYTKIVYLAIMEENPNFDDTKPELAQQLKKQFSYFRTRHPELYELHLAELKFESTYPQDATTTESGDDDDDDDDDDLHTTKL